MVPRLHAELNLPPAKFDAIEEHLNADNRRLTGRDDDQSHVFALRDETKRAVGVAAGYSWGGIAEFKLMWVKESYRGLGHGRKLLDAFVTEAADRGVRRIRVTTHDFQAPGLCEKAGFGRMAEFAGQPEGIPTLSFVRK
jgi:N-acetylglutamate synthase-like GNAT family acetyltransferase